jgi:hypothetical protein
MCLRILFGSLLCYYSINMFVHIHMGPRRKANNIDDGEGKIWLDTHCHVFRGV